MFFNKMPPISTLRRLFVWDLRQGKVYKREHPDSDTPGPEVGTPREAGYWYIHVAGYGTYRRGRLIWYMATGDDPEDLEIDHIDRTKDNDGIENLRAVTRYENALNTKISSHCKSGVRGVWQKANGKWCAKIRRHGIGTTLGQGFNSKEEAEAAYLHAEQRILRGDVDFLKKPTHGKRPKNWYMDEH